MCAHQLIPLALFSSGAGVLAAQGWSVVLEWRARHAQPRLNVLEDVEQLFEDQLSTLRTDAEEQMFQAVFGEDAPHRRAVYDAINYPMEWPERN